MGRMTDASIRKLVLEKRPLAIADGDGLTFTISSNLTAAWIVRYRYAGRPREITLGRWPQLGLKEARLETSRVRLDIAAGKDPAYEKKVRKERKRGNFTIAELFEEYLEERGPELSPVTVKNMRALFEKDVLPRIGSRLARDLTPQEVVGLIRTVKERSHSVARRIWESLSTVHAKTILACQKSNSRDKLAWSDRAQSAALERPVRRLAWSNPAIAACSFQKMPGRPDLSTRTTSMKAKRPSAIRLALPAQILFYIALWRVGAS